MCSKQLASLALYLAKRRPVSFPKRNVQELTVGKDSNPHLIAGAIAARVSRFAYLFARSLLTIADEWMSGMCTAGN